MNFYPFHIGDYMSRTAHLDPLEDIAYRRMIDLYFIREAGLPIDPVEIAKLIRMREHVSIIKIILNEFFVSNGNEWINDRCDYEINEAISKRNKAKASAAKRWQSECNANAKQRQCEGNAPNPNPNPKNNNVAYTGDFEKAWSEYPSRPGANKKSAFRAWKARIASGVKPETIIDGVKRYALYCETTAIDPRFIKQPATFFGPDEHYLAEYALSANADPFAGVANA